MLSPNIYGLLGYPVKHSFSPVMHNAAFAYLGINARYELFEKSSEELKDFLASLKSKNIRGLNVTIPYKEKVLNFVELDEESVFLRQIKAVNTIVLQNGIVKGFNTDIPGFIRHLNENIDPAGKKTAILGAGGAARAVVYAIAKSEAKDIFIYDVDKIKSESVVGMIKGLFPEFDIRAVDNIGQLQINEKDLLVNATPIGMKDADPCLIKEEMLHKNLFVYDLIYNPPETKLLTLSRKAGAAAVNGLKMLLYQGALSFKLWTNNNPPEEVMWNALQEEIKKCRKQ